MIGNWSNWKRFPNAQRGEHVEAPIGPGLYEVRKVSNGDLFAFDAAGNVAHALTALSGKSSSFSLARLFGGGRNVGQHTELEYRTCPAASVSEARVMAQALLGRRQAYWRRNSQKDLVGSI